VLASLLAQAAEIPDFVRPTIDWHALAPELTLLGVGALVTLVDVVYLERGKRISPTLAGIGLLAVLIPIITLAVDGTASSPRQAFTADNPIFSEVYVVDGYALILKALFIVIAYLVVLMSTNYIAEGDYWEAEYYGMVKAASHAIGIRSMMSDFGITTGIQLMVDASAAKGISMRRGLGKVRQLEVTQLWLQDKVAKGEIDLVKVHTSVNLADALTKYVDTAKLQYHMSQVKQIPEQGRHPLAPANA